jgi:hypothetical protein
MLDDVAWLSWTRAGGRRSSSSATPAGRRALSRDAGERPPRPFFVQPPLALAPGAGRLLRALNAGTRTCRIPSAGRICP